MLCENGGDAAGSGDGFERGVGAPPRRRTSSRAMGWSENIRGTLHLPLFVYLLINSIIMEQATKQIPKSLVYEMVDGKPIYYQGYKDYLIGNKQVDEIRSSNKLQALLVAELIYFLRSFYGNEYLIFTNELGLRFGKNAWRAADIAVIKSDLVEDLNDQYLDVPPELVIGIDTKADLQEVRNPLGYYHEKTEDLIQFGVAKVVWIFTDTRKVLVAEPGKKAWRIHDWADEVDLCEGLPVDLMRISRQIK